MFSSGVSALIALASVLFAFTFFFTDTSRPQSRPFTQTIPGWHHHESHIDPIVTLAEARKAPDPDWHIHHHLGGNGPWISNANSSNDLLPPPGCVVEQVHMLSRHAERYPTRAVGTKLLHLLQRLQHKDVSLTGELEFVNQWKFFTSDPLRDFNQLTRSGPYSGTLAAFTTGVRLCTRYGHLLDEHFRKRQTLHFFAGDSERVIETAQLFAAGLLGLNWSSQATLHIIPETPETGANALTPGKSCLAYLQDEEHGRQRGYKALAKFTDTTFEQTAKRLEQLISATKSKEFKLATVDVYAMQELCGFEILVRGSSPWCDVFTQEEWERFAYARDLLHFYRAGPGGKYSHAIGGLYLNATAELILQGPDAGPLFFSFVHDGDIAPVLTALRLLHDDGEQLPMAQIKHDRKWKTSRITPMGGRIIFERLRCSSRTDDLFVRININDGVVPIPGCHIGSGLCPLEQFVVRLRKHQDEAGDFTDICGLSESMPNRITFLHQ